MTQSFIVTAGRYSATVRGRMRPDREVEITRLGEFYRHDYDQMVRCVRVPRLALRSLEEAAVAAFWADFHDDTAIDRAEYLRGNGR
jgi:hypothetical protein